ncbi:MAG: methyltransferase regulatory domain-containing protein [Solirubrobacteraceae bacterium]|nr:methyltransferase regulatory domain-containing protein [Solirubrobacteraceae bacterium]
MADEPGVLYDEVPYPGRPFDQTHPDRLATLGRLYGLRSAAPSRCRLLELGCGDGGNLLPMACTLPASQFVGVDVSQRAVAAARARTEELGIDNVRFEESSLADFAPEPGSFDFVIAHGVYSWVDEPVRDALMAVSARALAEQGVAYVSYNTLPGGRLRDILRDILRSHVDPTDAPQRQLASAREMLAVLQAAWAYDTELHTLGSLAAKMLDDSDALLFHDTLAPVNARLHFEQFTEHAAGHGLQFLAEANFWEMQVGWLPHELRDGVLATDDRLRREQLLDQLRMRTFRQTLLCHASNALDDTPPLDRLATLAVSAQAQASAAQPDGRVTFTGANGSNLTTDHGVVIAALERVIAAWPAILPIAELWPSDALAEDRQIVCEALLRCYSAALASVHAEPAAFGTSAATHPRVTAMARLQAREGALVANLRHDAVTLDDPARALVMLLDGTRDRAALLAGLADAVEGPVARSELALWLERSLTQLAQSALLLAS